MNPAQLVRKPRVIRIQQRYDFPPRAPHPEIECRSLPAVGLLHITNGIAEFIQSLLGVVRRSVVDHKNFNPLAREILLEDAAHRLLDIPRVIKRIDQYRKERSSHPSFRGAILLRRTDFVVSAAPSGIDGNTEAPARKFGVRRLDAAFPPYTQPPIAPRSSNIGCSATRAL